MLQNIASLHVVGTRFDTIEEMETQNVGKNRFLPQ
jgi:hypothetical protein